MIAVFTVVVYCVLYIAALMHVFVCCAYHIVGNAHLHCC